MLIYICQYFIQTNNHDQLSTSAHIIINACEYNFRWKGENVSTTEVSNVVADLSWIHDANVYGVEIHG